MSLAEAREPDEFPSSGERLLHVLAVVELTPWEFAGYWAGFPVGAPIMQEEDSERGRRFRAAKRALNRWVKDEFVMSESAAFEVVEVANRLLKERRKRQLRADFLVTPEQERIAGMVEMRTLLDEILERLERLERKAR